MRNKLIYNKGKKEKINKKNDTIQKSNVVIG